MAATQLAESSQDPNVILPSHVTEASKAADALHEQFYPKAADQAAAPNKEGVPQPPPPDDQTQPPPDAAAQAAAQAAEAAERARVTGQTETPPPPSQDEQNITAEEWRHRFLSMQGRFNAKVRENGAMEEQMRQLAQELVRTQTMLANSGANVPPQAQNHGASQSNHEQLITDADREAYGTDLIDLTRRAARDAIAPELDQLRQENKALQTRVSTTGRRELFAELDRQLPTWRAINQSTQFKSWLRLPNVYTNALRGNMLKAAVDGAEAPKVLALFKDFLAEANATGSAPPAPQTEQQDPPPAPRTAAVNLESLAAPGRARPASGDSQVSSEKPIYTRKQIATYFDEKRRGLFAGREAECAAFEVDLGRAQHEGRVR
jgi:hypothetical protein